ncbi:hypothetical protein [Saccharopolyspora hattusasensis]|uniref:hypothetical protein n=1 Tax=Saccharopolyspora hattusasensis TaxID=1128679 RepID=UPI003D97B15E
MLEVAVCHARSAQRGDRFADASPGDAERIGFVEIVIDPVAQRVAVHPAHSNDREVPVAHLDSGGDVVDVDQEVELFVSPDEVGYLRVTSLKVAAFLVEAAHREALRADLDLEC